MSPKPTKRCEHCKTDFPPRDNEKPSKFSLRRFCSRSCASAARAPVLGAPIEERIRGRSIRTKSGCIEWTGARTSAGYGVISFRGSSLYTHRISWEVANRASAHGMTVMHSCDNPPCMNPDHLSAGTPADNMRDKCDKGRQGFGENWHSAKLTELAAIEIKARALSGEVKSALAREFGVSRSTVSMIASGKRWPHLA